MIQLKQALHWVKSNAELARCCEQWQSASCLAIDTEFMRTDTYYPIPALIQVNDGHANYLIDPLDVDQLESLKALFIDPSIEKVFHACSEDIEVFYRLFGCVPTPIFDTQIAAAFLGEGFSVGYGNLTKALLQVELPKGETRSNWLRRPLTEAQQHYAALDVEHLWQLRQLLTKRLEEGNRLHWLKQECEAIVENALQAQDPDYAINRFKSAWKLEPVSQVALKKLSVWRELKAQQKNKPRNHIVKERALYNLAEAMPQNADDMFDIEDLPDSAVNRYGEDWLLLLNATDQDNTKFIQKRPPNSVQKKQMNRMRDAIANLAEHLGVAPELLARKKDYETIVHALEEGVAPEKSLPVHFYEGWRQQFIMPTLMESLFVTNL